MLLGAVGGTEERREEGEEGEEEGGGDPGPGAAPGEGLSRGVGDSAGNVVEDLASALPCLSPWEGTVLAGVVLEWEEEEGGPPGSVKAAGSEDGCPSPAFCNTASRLSFKSASLERVVRAVEGRLGGSASSLAPASPARGAPARRPSLVRGAFVPSNDGADDAWVT